ncbi:MAG: Transcriptional regulator, TetR family [Nevskia sp.]|nr:Transcriptional regulator, TetR family [Nevskia sp.]
MAATLPKPTRLTLSQIIDAAIGLIHRDGFDALSMRKLAQQCDVGVMTLYGHVRTKEELLTAIAERFFSELRVPNRRLGWQQQLKEIFRSVHRVFVEHPELAQIVARQHINTTAAFRGAELAFAAMHQAGLDAEDAMSAFIALTAFTAGFAQRQMNLERQPAIAARRLAMLRELPASEFQHVSQLATLFVRGPTERDFETGLDFLIRGIASKVRA